jgi:folate-binding protein YgfZ
LRRLFLHAAHGQAGAKFTKIQNCSIPSHYGNVLDELTAMNQHVGLLDRSYLGKISLTGKDALELLNRISTNDLQYLAVGTMCDTVFVTPKGRLIDYCRVINSGEEFILIASFFQSDHLIEWINRFIILEDANVRDVSKDYLWMTLFGPRYKLFLGAFSHKIITDKDEAIWLNIEGHAFPALRNTNFKVPAYNFCFLKRDAHIIVPRLLDQLNLLNGKLIGDKAFQIIRVESGMPDWGTEITQDYNPHEARLTHAISFTKGCYTGQEVIARLNTYDKIQKYLMIIELSKKISQHPPMDVFIDEETVGHLTSYAYNPIYNRSIGLGYVKKMYAREDNIYVEVQVKGKRIPAKLILPHQSYAE